MHPITKANNQDINSIVNLLNITYRGDESLKGWTSEANIIKGEVRTDYETVADLMGQEGSIFLKCLDGKNELIGCVHLKKNGQRMYLGMLSVLPNLQGSGIGKRFLAEAEEYAGKLDCQSIYMQVISVRTELNDWYKRHGYSLTGEKKAFEVDQKYGNPIMPLEFVFLEKKLIVNK